MDSFYVIFASEHKIPRIIGYLYTHLFEVVSVHVGVDTHIHISVYLWNLLIIILLKLAALCIAYEENHHISMGKQTQGSYLDREEFIPYK